MIRLRSFALALSLAPAPALACGGFFCGGQPVDQVGEDILFLPGPGGTVEAHVRIAYAGEAEGFSWVVPVQGVPELALGSEVVFQALAQNTSPSWDVEIGDYSCANPYPSLGWGFEEDADTAGSGDDDSAGVDDSVDILSETTVGSYRATVVSAENANVLLTWLNCNGYDVPEASLPRIEAYLVEGYNFLALKLVPGATSGDLVPLAMRYAAAHPMIPIVLTAVATAPNLRIRAWFLAEGRAVPTNYDHVWLNDARVDWTNGPWWASSWWSGPGYTDLVGRAVDEAGGQAFVTDYAGSSAFALGGVYVPPVADAEVLRGIYDPAAFVSEALSIGVPRTTVMQGLLREHIPMPKTLVMDGVEEREFYNCLSCFAAELSDLVFDPGAFTDDIITLLLEPFHAVAALTADGSRPYLTRMQTTLSGWEMNRDPNFTILPPGKMTEFPTSFPHVGDVPRVRVAPLDFLGGDATVQCWDVDQVVQTASGVGVLVHEGKSAGKGAPPLATLPSCHDLPASMVVERFGEDGSVELLVDRRAEIQALVPDGSCAPSATEAAPTDPPEGTDWPPAPDLMVLGPPDPIACEEIEENGATGFGNEEGDGGKGDDDASDDDTAGDDDTSATEPPVDLVDDSVVAPLACETGAGSGGSVLALLLLLVPGRRRR